jgi:integrase
MKLDDKKVDHCILPATGQTEILDTLMPGLRLRVSSKGAKAWTVLTRALVDGEKKLVRATLGHYPHMKVAAARDAARDYLRAIQEGANPLALKAEKQAVKVTESVNTYGAVRDQFLKIKAKELKAKTFDEYDRVLRGTDFAPWEHRPLASITRANVRSLLADIEKRVSAITANKAFVYFRVMLNWAVQEDILSAAPTDKMKPPTGAAARDRVLLEEELRVLWAALPAAGVFAPLFKLLALTGQRREEIAALLWDEVRDLDGKSPHLDLAADRVKNAKRHLVPLAPAAAAILRELRDADDRIEDSRYVFTTTGKTPLSGFSRIKRTLDAAIAAQVEKEVMEAGDDKDRIKELRKLFAAGWRLHDLRRTLVTGLNDREVLPHVVEAIVNHVSGAAKAGVAGTYNHALYMNERRVALESWARHIESIGTPPVGATVLPLTARSA